MENQHANSQNYQAQTIVNNTQMAFMNCPYLNQIHDAATSRLVDPRKDPKVEEQKPLNDVSKKSGCPFEKMRHLSKIADNDDAANKTPQNDT